jgi:ribosome-binding factor A
MSNLRQEKISSLLKRLAAEFFLKNVGEIGVLASVTKVEISADLFNAKIFFSVLPENEERKILKQLFALKKDFRRHIARNLKIKFIPRVIFLIDESIKKQRKIDEALAALK